MNHKNIFSVVLSVVFSRYIRLLVFFGYSIMLSGCANYFIKKECQSLNWYQVGFDAALRGDRISNDEKVSQCRKVEAEMSESQLDTGFKAGMSKYCQPETVFQTGKSGDTFNLDFCDSSGMAQLQKRHTDGNRAYCTDGYSAGVSGKKYKNVCSAELEKGFMPEYRKGRKKFLDGMVQVAEAKKRELSVDIDRLSYEKRIHDNRRSVIPIIPIGQPDPYANERGTLDSKLGNIEYELRNKQSQKQKLDTEIGVYKSELISLN